ncbi:MAG: septal ring lytic transglycosylase RlpA family protein [Cyanobacteria bacterium P01_A01_bin.135]
MQFFTAKWLSPYIGSWLLFQSAVNLSVVPGVANLVQPDETLTEAVEDAGEPAMALSLADTLPAEVTTSDQDSEKPASTDLQRPWRLPNATTPIASVRVAEREPGVTPLAYSVETATSQTADRRCLPWATSNTAPSLPFQVLVNDQVVAEFPQRQQAQKLGKQLQARFAEASAQTLDPSTLTVTIDGESVVGQWQQRLFAVDDTLAEQLGHSASVVAITWVNALRGALDHAPLPLADTALILTGLSPTKRQFSGTASWYGPYFHGRTTANGETFNQNALTAAHPSLPFNTYLKVTNQVNGRSVVVRINDRGPYIGRRSLDLSRRAASCLGSEVRGIVPYKATVLKPA